MHIGNIFGAYLIIPATILLTISFFVLFTLRKVDSAALKAFGYVIAALLWFCSSMVFSFGMYKLITGRPHLMYQMMETKQRKHMMMQNMQGMMGSREMSKDEAKAVPSMPHKM